MKLIRNFALGFAFLAFGASSVQADIVISRVIEDGWAFNNTSRDEYILNNSGTNPGRWSIARFDTTILAAKAYTDSGQFTLSSATLTLTEDATRDSNNAALSGRVGAYFMNTTENADWSIGPATFTTGGAAAGTTFASAGWFGNSSGRPGNFGGGTTGANNVDERSNGATDLTFGLASPAPTGDGASWVSHTFTTTNANEVAVINLTNGGATFSDIQSLLGSWVGGNNGGLILAGEFGNQSFWSSNGVGVGQSVGSSIDGNTANSGVALTTSGGEGINGRQAFLTFTFTAVPEPGSLTLLGLVGLGLVARRRK